MKSTVYMGVGVGAARGARPNFLLLGGGGGVGGGALNCCTPTTIELVLIAGV